MQVESSGTVVEIQTTACLWSISCGVRWRRQRQFEGAREAARDLIRFPKSPDTVKVIRAQGMTPLFQAARS